MQSQFIRVKTEGDYQPIDSIVIIGLASVIARLFNKKSNLPTLRVFSSEMNGVNAHIANAFLCVNSLVLFALIILL